MILLQNMIKYGLKSTNTGCPKLIYIHGFYKVLSDSETGMLTCCCNSLSFCYNKKKQKKHMRITCWTNASCVSLTTCFPVYVEDTVTARTSVIGILEVVHKQWDQAASKQQSVRQKSRITLCLLNVWKNVRLWVGSA